MKKYLYLCLLISLLSCTKDFLDARKDKSMIVPLTIEDYLAMLDNQTLMNSGGGYTLAEMSTDDYFVAPSQWKALSNATYKSTYIWEKDIFNGDQSYDWNRNYTRILNINTVLEGIQNLDLAATSAKDRDYVRACALFHRSYAHYLLVSLFADTYRAADPESALGIPFKTSSKIDEQNQRGTLKDSYTKIISDLLEAADLFTDESIPYQTRPSKAAVWALLSRIYLSMGDYGLCWQYSEKALKIHGELMDYNLEPINQNTPFNKYNKEVIFIDAMSSTTLLTQTRLQIDTMLLEDYNNLDLRKTAYFRENGSITTFKGSYNGNSAFFIGLTTSETYLNAIESLIRLGEYEQARKLLKNLLNKRYSIAMNISEVIPHDDRLLAFVLGERRKELVFRGIRWTDLKRLNLESDKQIALKRNIDGDLYTLMPNSPNYVFPIPDNAVALGQYEQNPRE